MENLLFEQKIKSWNKQNLMENKTEIMEHVLKMQKISFLPIYI